VKKFGITFWLMLGLSLALPPEGLAAVPGSLDANFNPPLVAAGTNSGAAVYVVALQPDGQILIGGLFFAVSDTTNLLANMARLNPDGSIDPSFLPGRVADTGYVDAIGVQADGKIVVGGSFYSSRGNAPVNLLRLNADGTLDSGFFRFSEVDGPVNTVLLQSDGKILIGGGFTVVDGLARQSLARLNANGTVDSGFDACVASTAGSGGTSLAVQSNGQILASGTFVFNSGLYRDGVARLSGCGVLDSTYAREPGVNAEAVVFTTALRSTGELLLGGKFGTFHNYSRSGLAQLNTSGNVETTFNPGTGIDSSTTVYAMTIQGDGKVIIGGNFNQYDSQSRIGLARINLDGSLDTAFDPGSGPNNSVSSLAIQSDNRVLVAGKFTTFNGQARNGLARLNGDYVPFRFGRSLRLDNGQFQALFYGEDQMYYEIQASSNFVDWASLTNLTATAAPALILDPDAGSYRNRFYRAVFFP
jgi:uncharacterized delta-60 repeat protein